MNYELIESGEFRYFEYGEGTPIVLLHGLFGALSNFSGLIERFSPSHKLIVPMLPIYHLPLRQSTIDRLLAYVERFIAYKELDQFVLLGNSLGGHISLLYTLAHQEKLKSLVLTGSSGLFESALGDTFPRRGDYEYIKKKAEDIFYNPAMATKELVDEVFNAVNQREKAMRVVSVAKSAIRHNIGSELHRIHKPVLLIWGRHDQVTPPFVADEFHEKLPNSTLRWIEDSGHAPMMECPDQFSDILKNYLSVLETETETNEQLG